MSGFVTLDDDIGDPDAPVGSIPRIKWAIAQTERFLEPTDRDISNLQHWLGVLESTDSWTPLGYISYELMCVDKFHLEAGDLRAIKEAKKGQCIGSVVTKAKAQGALKEQGNPAPSGHNQHTPEGDRANPDNIRVTGYGTDPTYLARRMMRDAPEIFAQLEAGKFPSVRAAAIAAGIVKVPTPLEVAKRAWAKLGAEDRREFARWQDEETRS